MNAPPTPPVSFRGRVLTTMRRHPWMSAFFVFVVTWYSFWWFFRTPIRNPFPNEPFVIKGRFPFEKGYELVFIINVVGKADWHQWLCGGRVAEKAVCRAGRTVLKPTKVDGNHYEITLYSDYFLSGPQKWELRRYWMVYDPAFGVDPEKTGSALSREGPVTVCDDDPESKVRRKGRLFCLSKDEEESISMRKYRELRLSPSSEPQPGVTIRDYWLRSELDAMLAR